MSQFVIDPIIQVPFNKASSFDTIDSPLATRVATELFLADLKTIR